MVLGIGDRAGGRKRGGVGGGGGGGIILTPRFGPAASSPGTSISLLFLAVEHVSYEDVNQTEQVYNKHLPTTPYCYSNNTILLLRAQADIAAARKLIHTILHVAPSHAKFCGPE